MKTFNSIYTILLTALVVALLTVSCKKLIEIPANPPDQIPQSQVFSDSADIMSALTGIYGNFKVTSGGTTFTNGAITQYTGMSADELLYASVSSPANNQFALNALTTDNGTIVSLWQNAYNNIYQMNTCLQGIGGTKAISDSLRRQLLAEIKVVRALYYFNLVNLFGRLPIITGTDYKLNAVVSRSSVDSVYGLIRSDLAEARAVLHPTYPSAGRARPNLHTAEALSAKVFLYLKQWDSAALMAGNVIQSGNYSLESDLNRVFLDGSSEAIWQLPANGSYNQTSEGATFVPYTGSRPMYTLTNFQLNAFETNDNRRSTWVKDASAYGTTYYIPFKYKERSVSGSTVEDYMVFRLGEQYLILAEAQAQQQHLSDALDNLNVVRGRAGLAASTAATQEDLLAAIMHERQVELFCEWGNRWYDLKRTGTIDAVLGAEKPNAWQPYAALYPIPQAEIQYNYLLAQNDGY
ncbi:RagB/SusD family nutrient uptake outer membrane protein [Flavitalea sp. BT771]|uniref:RagB/SusD family nutrient uptake outer membrane protein n=1 Tax=Flavitalea sp. BT771 TaxID=3063329 RepID=UPI0026E477EB|nr:RagB/SusD family nutrient uptake outer membrane protein [Flavitalea sp. BT771]MDO6433154.1 RagB/SusD family nutrient uptake outer membrane protein [Flavitalea sp. BT771]MDV6221570.1 RagB/SusD family nutrient uptake outer membrane protein [Flavitalea sp. BT771]